MNFLESYIDSLSYNGYDEQVIQLMRWINNRLELKPKEYVDIPDFISALDCDHPIHILWSVLVLSHGNYGTSPRYGWLEPSQQLINTINTIIHYVEE